jgi:putative nucleotidyltransferase with HDIG domain
MEIANTINEIKVIFKKNGQNAYFGENISQLAHAAQCMKLAEIENESLEMQVAAFLHDIGHMLPSLDQSMGELGNINHEEIAAEWLEKRGFSLLIQTVIQNHVKAKKYLCYIDSEYFSKLSKASQETLKFQGGIMDFYQAIDFENSPFFIESIKLRKWDDQGKVEGLKIPGLNECIEKVKIYLEGISEVKLN